MSGIVLVKIAKQGNRTARESGKVDKYSISKEEHPLLPGWHGHEAASCAQERLLAWSLDIFGGLKSGRTRTCLLLGYSRAGARWTGCERLRSSLGGVHAVVELDVS